MKRNPVKTARNKADKALQEWSRNEFERCEVCGHQEFCGHHFIKKSKSNALRYNPRNIVPLCGRCHSLHHNYDDASIHNIIIKTRGMRWLNYIEEHRQNTVKTNKDFYEKAIKRFS